MMVDIRHDRNSSSPSTNKKNNYDNLLNKSLMNSCPVEHTENKEMKRWSNEATDYLRSQSQEYRSKPIH